MNTALNKKFFSYVIPSILAFALSGVYTIVDGVRHLLHTLCAHTFQPAYPTRGRQQKYTNSL